MHIIAIQIHEYNIQCVLYTHFTLINGRVHTHTHTALMVPERTYYPGLRIEPCAAVWDDGPAEGKCAEQETNIECGTVPVPEVNGYSSGDLY